MKNQNNNTSNDSGNTKIIKNFRKEINTLNYEESLAQLDTLLEKLQSETVPVQELQDHYLKASLYLERCQQLLENIEHDIIELDFDSLK